jgi:hypothetical protein
MTTKIIRTFAAIAFVATALTTVAATGSAFAEGGYGHGRSYHSHGFGRHYGDFRRDYVRGAKPWHQGERDRARTSSGRDGMAGAPGTASRSAR